MPETHKTPFSVLGRGSSINCTVELEVDSADLPESGLDIPCILPF